MSYRTDYSNEEIQEEVYLEDPERIQALLSDIDSIAEAEDILEPGNTDEQVEAAATYELVHPYDGEEFMHSLLHNKQVTADIEVEIMYGASEKDGKTVKGRITDNAYDIFHPPEMPDEELQSQSAEVDAPTREEHAAVD